jgi:hypothetical protein
MSSQNSEYASWKIMKNHFKNTSFNKDLDDDSYTFIMDKFKELGGSWEEIILGNYRHFNILFNCLKLYAIKASHEQKRKRF